jgi:UDP-N-acetylglucosamine 2-epimerase (non-hydrolysing)
VNSTIAAAMTAREYNIPVAHVEAGLRSFDMTMPEEINRILTDRISSFLFVTEKSGMLNLRKEGADEKNIHFVGNVMIDSLIHQMPLIEKTDIAVPEIPYMMLTLHRPSNVDNKDKLEAIIAAFREISWKTAIIFPCHPRTMKNLETHGIQAGRKIDISETGSIKTPSIYMMSPIGYNEFIKLVRHSLGVITDSGGIQEETTYMKIPCLTLRDNTERPVTMEIGTNILIGSDLELLKKSAIDIINGRAKTGEIPPLWDGKASERILDILENKFYS